MCSLVACAVWHAGAAGVSLDLAKAAKLLAEIAAADKDAEVDLSGLQLIAADAEFVASAGHLVRSQAQVTACCRLRWFLASVGCLAKPCFS